LLRRLGMFGGARRPFGDLSLPATQLHADHINHQVVGTTAILDDMMAALANFALYVAIAGQAEGLPTGETRVSVSEVGIYVRDSFDFNGDQIFGYWSDSFPYASALWNFGLTHVQNSDFRDWRTRTGRGGDFQAFSDVKRVAVNPPDVFTVT